MNREKKLLSGEKLEEDLDLRENLEEDLRENLKQKLDKMEVMIDRAMDIQKANCWRMEWVLTRLNYLQDALATLWYHLGKRKLPYVWETIEVIRSELKLLERRGIDLSEAHEVLDSVKDGAEIGNYEIMEDVVKRIYPCVTEAVIQWLIRGEEKGGRRITREQGRKRRKRK